MKWQDVIYKKFNANRRGPESMYINIENKPEYALVYAGKDNFDIYKYQYNGWHTEQLNIPLRQAINFFERASIG